MERDHGSADGNLQTPNLRLEIDYQGKPAEGEDRKRTISIQKETGKCDADVPEDHPPVHRREGDIINLTPQVAAAVRESAVLEGLVHLFVMHSTAALTTIEFTVNSIVVSAAVECVTKR